MNIVKVGEGGEHCQGGGRGVNIVKVGGGG